MGFETKKMMSTKQKGAPPPAAQRHVAQIHVTDVGHDVLVHHVAAQRSKRTRCRAVGVLPRVASIQTDVLRHLDLGRRVEAMDGIPRRDRKGGSICCAVEPNDGGVAAVLPNDPIDGGRAVELARLL